MSKNNVISFKERVKKLKTISEKSSKQEEKVFTESTTESTTAKSTTESTTAKSTTESTTANTIENSTNHSAKSSENKTIAFPGSKISSIQKALDADTKFKTILGGRIISTLLGMFVLTIAAQSLWFSEKNTNKNDRNLASVIGRSLASIEAYLSKSDRGVASVAKLPSKIENFNFGALHGRYTIQAKGQFITSLSSNGKFIQIASVARFLKKYRNLWQLKFASLRLSNTDKGSKIYTLLDKNKKILGKAIVRLDGQGNLQSLKFTKTQL